MITNDCKTIRCDLNKRVVKVQERFDEKYPVIQVAFTSNGQLCREQLVDLVERKGYSAMDEYLLGDLQQLGLSPEKITEKTDILPPQVRKDPELYDLSDLKRKGIIITREDHLIKIDWEGLEYLAEDDCGEELLDEGECLFYRKNVL